MRLSTKDREILLCAEFMAHAPVSVVSRKTGYREHTVRNTLDRCREEGILSKNCFVDLFRIGFSQFEVFFRIGTMNLEIRRRFAERLRSCERVSWMGEFVGDFDYGINYCAEHLTELSEFFDTLISDFPEISFQKALAVRMSLSYFGSKYLDQRREQTAFFSYKAGTERITVDALDHRILQLLVDHSSESRRRLAQMLDVPLSTLELRIKRLIDKGVIVGFYNWIRPSGLQMHSFLLFITLKGISNEFRSRFHSFCRTHPNILLSIQTVGNWDYEIGIEVEESRELNRVRDEIHRAFADYISEIRAVPSFGYHKVREYPFAAAPHFSGGKFSKGVQRVSGSTKGMRR